MAIENEYTDFTLQLKEDIEFRFENTKRNKTFQ